MAKKTTTAATPKKAAAKKVTAKVEVSVPAAPAVSAEQASIAAVQTNGTTDQAPKVVTYEMIAERAYDLYVRGIPGTAMDHWLQAERELKG